MRECWNGGWSAVLLLLMLAGCSVPAWTQTDADAAGERALLEGRADEAVRILRTAIAANEQDARAHLLLCRVFLSEDLAEEAVPECDAAATLAPKSSDAQLWLGRALGAKASAANVLSAFQLARRVRTAFERAVELDPLNGPATSDLGQFYVEAPGVVGGGLEKARTLAERMRSMPTRMHRLQAQAAEKAGDLATAEAEYRRAGSSPEALVDLGQFFANHARADEAVTTVRAAVAADRSHGPATVDAALILKERKRSPELAVTWLRQYLESPARTDAAPAFRVHVAIGDLLMAAGNSRAAGAEYAAARALASGYGPARK